MLATSPGVACSPDGDAQAVAILAELVAGTLSLARALAMGQRQLDLKGLDTDVGLLCARVLELRLDLGKAIRPKLAALLAELDALEASLVQP